MSKCFICHFECLLEEHDSFMFKELNAFSLPPPNPSLTLTVSPGLYMSPYLDRLPNISQDIHLVKALVFR